MSDTKKAVIQTGGKQYVVSESETIKVELLKNSENKLHAKGDKLKFAPLLIVDGSEVSIGKPSLDKSSVSAEVINADQMADKVTSIRFKAKKRVRTVRGHRQHQTVIKITKIA